MFLCKESLKFNGNRNRFVSCVCKLAITRSRYATVGTCFNSASKGFILDFNVG